MTETKWIRAKYEFKPDEIKTMSKDVTEKEVEKEKVEFDKKEAVDAFNAKIKGLQSKISYLSNCVHDGFEMREYKCRIERDSTTQMRTYRDIDTEMIIKEEPFTPEDFQQTMKLD